MNQEILFSQFTIDELETRLINRFRIEFQFSTPNTPKESFEEYLTRKEAAKKLRISLVTLNKWQKDGKIKYHRYGSRIRFKWSEILTAAK